MPIALEIVTTPLMDGRLILIHLSVMLFAVKLLTRMALWHAQSDGFTVRQVPPQKQTAIHDVRCIHLGDTHTPPVPHRFTIQQLVHIRHRVQNIVIHSGITAVKAQPPKPKVACHAAKDAVHRVRRRVLKPAARDAVPVAANRVVSVANYMNRAQQGILVRIMPIHAAVQNTVQNTVHNMVLVMGHVMVPSMAHNMEHTLAVVQNT